ncbi:MAG: tyrosine recombinase XerD [Eubacteriaceae bacterium]|nr:tyrosine recombinase XerD [Eubacteriaceae bacterium]
MYLDGFIDYLRTEKRRSSNTQEAYRRDYLNFEEYMKTKSIYDLKDVSNTEIVSYLYKLKDEGKSAATVNRKLASLRALYTYMKKEGIVSRDPTEGIKSPRVGRKEIEYLTIEEVDSLLALPDDSVKGKRDKAILELLYATGIRVNELVATDVEDINLRIGFYTCNGDAGKARIIPIGKPARRAVEDYIFNSRDILLKENEDEKALFVNYYGGRMTRQGLWKLLKAYGDKAGLGDRLTPHTLRNSFAVHMLQNGADLKSLQELMGHEDLTATQIYLSVTRHRIKDVYDRTHPRA